MLGVLAPNPPLRAGVTAQAQPAKLAVVQTVPATTGEGVPAVLLLGDAISPTPPTPGPAPPKRAAHYLWAVLMARIYEVFPLLCPICGGQMQIIAFITHSADIRQTLEHIGVETVPPRIAGADRMPPICWLMLMWLRPTSCTT